MHGDDFDIDAIVRSVLKKGWLSKISFVKVLESIFIGNKAI